MMAQTNVPAWGSKICSFLSHQLVLFLSSHTLRKTFTPPTSSSLIVTHTVIPGPEIFIALPSYFPSATHSPSSLNRSKHSALPFPFHRAGNPGFSTGRTIFEVGREMVEVLGLGIGGRGVSLGGRVL
jgi:hypothetical protein